MRDRKKTRMTKARKRAVALGLIALMATLNPTKVLAENPKVEYVKEFTMASGASVKEAKKVLEKAGYKAKEEPISSLSNKVVLLGYKTTQNRSEAITDVKAMNENGDFSSANLQKSLENQSKEIKKMINQWKPAIEEFQENYGDGSKATVPAQVAKMAMDTLYEDDSKKLMGDFLLGLDFDKEEDKEAFTSVLMQGNSRGIATLQDALTTACAEVQVTNEGSGPCNWIERYCEYSSDKDFDSKYAYGASVLNQYSKSVKGRLSTYFETMKLSEVGGTSKNYKAYMDKIASEKTSESEQKVAELSLAKAVYDSLHGHKCRILREEKGKMKKFDIDMVDFFQREDLSDKDFYPMAKAMTEGQKSMLVYVGLEEMICLGGKTATKWKKAQNDVQKRVREIFEDKKQDCTSIYEGVNRKMFDQELIKKGHIALTKNASQYCDLTKDYSWSEGKTVDTSDTLDDIMQMCAVVCVLLAVGGVMVGGALRVIGSSLDNMVMHTVGKRLVILGVVALIAMIVFLAIGVNSKNSDSKETERKEKPQILVDERLLEIKGGECAKVKGYIVYDAVKDLKGNVADLNSDDDKQWIALYQTKYTEAGDPITTDFVLSDKIISDSKYKEVQKFSSKGAMNLASFRKNEGSLYMYVQKKVLDFGHASERGSVFGSGINLIFGSIGLLIGAAGVGLFDRTKRRKKEVA